MKFGSVGAVIAAASKKDAVPLLKVGSIPIVRRIVLILQQAGVFPIVLRSEILPQILAYNGPDGLRGAVRQSVGRKQRIAVSDAGVLMSVHNEPQLRQHLQEHNASLLTPSAKISIDKENMFLNSRLKLLLFLIADLCSVRQACLHMGLSYQKAWDMINRLERELGYAVVTRQHGGKNGGCTCLTDKGQQLMYAFQHYENEVRAFAQQRFDALFRETGLI